MKEYSTKWFPNAFSSKVFVWFCISSYFIDLFILLVVYGGYQRVSPALHDIIYLRKYIYIYIYPQELYVGNINFNSLDIRPINLCLISNPYFACNKLSNEDIIHRGHIPHHWSLVDMCDIRSIIQSSMRRIHTYGNRFCSSFYLQMFLLLTVPDYQ